ncbi:MAG: hemolysin, partial [Algoriphagus sp.]
AFVLLHPNVKYLFGKVTMYPHYNREARDLLLYFMNHYFPDNQDLVKPKEKLRLSYETDILSQPNPFDGLDYKEGYKVLNGRIRALGENIPPLINAYMNLSPTMKNFGTALNDEFGEVEETGILLTLDDIYDSKKHRHMDTFERDRHYGQRVK